MIEWMSTTDGIARGGGDQRKGLRGRESQRPDSRRQLAAGMMTRMANPTSPRERLAQLRAGIRPEAQTLLDRIFNEHRKTGKPLTRTELHLQGGGSGTVRKLLSELGGSVVTTTRASGSDPEGYTLTLLGALLTNSGRALEDALCVLVEYLRTCIRDSPRFRQFGSKSLQAAGMAEAQLGQLRCIFGLYSRHLSWRETSSENEWTARIPEHLIDGIVEAEDVHGLVCGLLLADYDPTLPVEEQERMAFGLRPKREGLFTAETGAKAAGDLHCNHCGRITLHEVKSAYTQEPRGSVAVSLRCKRFDLLECCGCQTVVLRERHELATDVPHDPIEFYFPDRLSRPIPAWVSKMGRPAAQDLFREVYGALQQGCRRLALMGCRALLDEHLSGLVGDLGSFQRQVAELEKKGVITERQGRTLLVTFDAGSAAMHRAFEPSAVVLNQVLDVVEHVLREGLIMGAVDAIEEATPERERP